jgi:hypothetical protein
LAESIFFGVALFGGRSRLLGQLLLVGVEIRLRPTQQTEAMEACQQERIGGIEQGSA